MNLYGYVKDQSGAPISGAQVSIVDDLGGFIGVNVTTSAQGYFYLDDSFSNNKIDTANDQIYVNAPGYTQTVFPVANGQTLVVQKATAATTTTTTKSVLPTVQQGANILTDLLNIFAPKPAPTPVYYPQNATTPQQSTFDVTKLFVPLMLGVVVIMSIKKWKKKGKL